MSDREINSTVVCSGYHFRLILLLLRSKYSLTCDQTYLINLVLIST